MMIFLFVCSVHHAVSAPGQVRKNTIPVTRWNRIFFHFFWKYGWSGLGLGNAFLRFKILAEKNWMYGIVGLWFSWLKKEAICVHFRVFKLVPSCLNAILWHNSKPEAAQIVIMTKLFNNSFNEGRNIKLTQPRQKQHSNTNIFRITQENV